MRSLDDSDWLAVVAPKSKSKESGFIRLSSRDRTVKCIGNEKTPYKLEMELMLNE